MHTWVGGGGGLLISAHLHATVERYEFEPGDFSTNVKRFNCSATLTTLALTSIHVIRIE